MNNLQIAKTIKKLCKQNNVSISKMLADCDLTKSFIYDLEVRNSAPSVDKILAIADYFKVSVGYILGKEYPYFLTDLECKMINTYRGSDLEAKKFIVGTFSNLSMQTNFTESDYLVAFIDALGSKHQMRENNIEWAEKLYKAFDASRGLHLRATESLKQNNIPAPDISYRIFSDNIFFALNLSNISEGALAYSIYYFIDYVAFFQAYATSELEIFFRGCITSGKMILNNLLISGEAIVDAVEGEKNAEYPRIKLTDNIANKYREIITYIFGKAPGDTATNLLLHDNKKKTVFNKDEGGLYYLNYLAYTLLWKGSTEIKRLYRLADRFYEENRETETIAKKYTWFKNYCEKYYSDYLGEITPLYREVAAHNDEKAHEEKPEITPETTPPQK